MRSKILIRLTASEIMPEKMFVCLFSVFRPTLERIFSLIWRRTITSEGLQILTNARHLWSLSSDCSLACHTYCDTRHPFIMFIFKDLWHSHPCRTLDIGAVATCFYDLGLSRLGFEHLTFPLRGKRSNRLRHHRGFENMWIQTIKKVVFATKDAHWYKNVML